MQDVFQSPILLDVSKFDGWVKDCQVDQSIGL